MRFRCLERPRPAFSLICIHFYRFSLIFIDFHGFGRHLKPRKSNPLWQPVAACGGLWRPVAACGGRMDSHVFRFLRIWRHSVLVDDECKIDGRRAGAWRLLDDEWKTDWKRFSHA